MLPFPDPRFFFLGILFLQTLFPVEKRKDIYVRPLPSLMQAWLAAGYMLARCLGLSRYGRHERLMRKKRTDIAVFAAWAISTASTDYGVLLRARISITCANNGGGLGH